MIQNNLKTVPQLLGNDMPPDQQQGAVELLQCLPKAFRLIREGAGYRQTDAAARSGLSKAMLSAYETGKTLPSLGSLTTLLAAIGKDFADLQDAIDKVRGASPERQPAEKDLEREVGQVVLKAIQYVIERKERDATSGSARDGGEAQARER
ncbi:MAG: helix-turn-helix domain-containing protein [Thermoanaerobaculia bacterium]